MRACFFCGYTSMDNTFIGDKGICDECVVLLRKILGVGGQAALEDEADKPPPEMTQTQQDALRAAMGGPSAPPMPVVQKPPPVTAPTPRPQTQAQADAMKAAMGSPAAPKAPPQRVVLPKGDALAKPAPPRPAAPRPVAPPAQPPGPPRPKPKAADNTLVKETGAVPVPPELKEALLRAAGASPSGARQAPAPVSGRSGPAMPAQPRPAVPAQPRPAVPAQPRPAVSGSSRPPVPGAPAVSGSSRPPAPGASAAPRPSGGVPRAKKDPDLRALLGKKPQT